MVYGFGVEGTGSDDPHEDSSLVGPVDILAILKVNLLFSREGGR